MRRERSGQSLVEFALIAPITLLLLLAVIDIGALLSAKNSVAYASRQAARLMEAYGNSSPDPAHPTASPDTYILTAVVDTLRGSGLDLRNLRQVVFFKGPAENQTPNPNPAWTGDASSDHCVYTFTNGVANAPTGAASTYCADPTNPTSTVRQDGEYAGVSITYHYPGITPFYRTGVDFTDVTNVQIDPRSANGYSLPTPVPTVPVPATWTPAPTSTNAPSGSIVDASGPQSFSGPIVLSSSGISDWAHWGGPSTSSTNYYLDRLSSGNSINLTPIGTGTVQHTSSLSGAPTFSWSSNGTPDASGGTTSCIYVSGTSNGFKITVPAGTTAKTLKLYVGALGATGQLSASLSDSATSLSGPSESFTASTTASIKVYTLTYNAASDGQTLTVTFTDADTASGFVGLFAATLT